MKIKKMMIALALLSGVAMVGCNNNEESQEVLVNKDIVMEDVKNQMLASNLLTANSVESIPKDHWIFESVKDVIEDGFMSQAMINVKLQDVFLIKTTDVDAVEKVLLDYKENSLRSFGDGYGGEDNIKAVANSKLVKMDGYVYFIATPNADEVEAKLLELIK